MCKRCEMRGLQCPGYEKSPKYYHMSASGKAWQETSQLQLGVKTRQKRVESGKKALVSYMDGYTAPNLVQKALCIQQKDMFGQFVDATFPGLYYSWSTRVDENFMDFVRKQGDTSTDALVWASWTLCTLSIGQKTRDRKKIETGRMMYTRCLHFLARLIQNPKTVKSDHTLGTAVLLAIYEMMDGSFHQSWLTHSSGIAALFQHRGPEAHRDGFGRTLLISFRAFLLADALIRGEPCFLAEPAWRSVIIEAMKAEGKAGKGSQLGDLVECAFHEITVCPGLVAQVRETLTRNYDDIAQRKVLTRALSVQRGRLESLHNRMFILLSQGKIEDRPDLVGPIPREVVHLLTKFSLRGIDMALMLLDRLLSALGAGQKGINWIGGYPNKHSILLLEDGGSDGGNATEAPDHLALSMGMLALR